MRQDSARERDIHDVSAKPVGQIMSTLVNLDDNEMLAHR